MKRIRFILVILLAAALAACNKSVTNEGVGQLTIKVTDAPFPADMFESAYVTISKVEIRQAGDSSLTGNPFIVLRNDTITFNLLELRNGVVEKLLDTEIPSGKYDLIRLYVAEAGLKIKDGETHKVRIPGGSQTGIKIFVKPAINVAGGLTSELLLDFDLSRSFQVIGSMNSPHGINGFHFKPVIRAVNNSTAGRIRGSVTDTSLVKIGNAQVWVKQDSVIATTFTDTLGHYAILGLPAGDYTVFAAKENYDTVSYSGVKVVSGNMTVRDFMLTHK